VFWFYTAIIVILISLPVLIEPAQLEFLLLVSDIVNARKTVQYFLRVADGQLENLLHTFTFLPLTEIRHIMERHQQNPDARLGQLRLAEAATLLVHGEEGLGQATTTTSILYGEDMESLGRLSLDEARAIFQQADFVQRLYQPGLSVLGR
jgi:tyrosyl-tRNA synthetase